MNKISQVLFMAVTWCLVPVPAAWAADTRLHQETESFRVDIGVIPAQTLRQRPAFIDENKELHGDLLYRPDMHHLTASVLDARSGERVSDATVIANVRHQKWRHGLEVERPLGRMKTGGTITYGNFFRMADPGSYTITVKIYRPQGDRAEIARFSYTKPEE